MEYIIVHALWSVSRYSWSQIWSYRQDCCTSTNDRYCFTICGCGILQNVDNSDQV